jgi:DNA-binding transcriptional ArsR family regulator
MPKTPALLSHRQLVDIAKALGHPARLRILAMLQHDRLCVCQMATLLELAASTISGHLNDLRRSGLVVEDKVGKLVYYSLDRASPAARWLRAGLALVATDERLQLDAALIGRVQAVPVEILTRGGLKLSSLRRSRDMSPSRAPTRRP